MRAWRPAVSRRRARTRIGSVEVAAMLRSLSRLLAVASVLALPSSAVAQKPGDSFHPLASPDPTWDGATKGALVGAGAMAGLLTIAYARCDAGCEAPAHGPMFAWGLGVGAGSGAAIGWVIDRLHKVPAPTRAAADPTRNGVLIGASIGALAGLAAGGAVADRCGPFCNTPESHTYLVYGGIGAGAGAATGWLIDRLQVRHRALPAVAVRADRQARAVRMAWRF
jgi:hypothetical protein